MGETRALILDGHSRAALECVQALGRAGVCVDVAAAAGALAFKSVYARRTLRQPPAGEGGAFLKWLKTEAGDEGCRLIVASTEASLLALRELPETHPLRRKALLSTNRALDAALDKEFTWRLARELQIPVPESRLITTPAEAGEGSAAYPIVLKPVRSKVNAGGELITLEAAIVRDAAQRNKVLSQWLPLTPVQEQRFVPGRGVGLEFLYWQGRELWHFAHRRLHELPLSGGASTYREAIAPPPELLAAGRRLLDALEWHGPAMVEFRQANENEFYLMEINPRLWGSLALTIDAGLNFPLALWQLAGGAMPPPQPDYRIGHRTRNIVCDLQWLKANLLADRRDPLLLTRPRLAAALEWLRVLHRNESWDHFQWRDRRVFITMLAQALNEISGGISRRIFGK